MTYRKDLPFTIVFIIIVIAGIAGAGCTTDAAPGSGDLSSTMTVTDDTGRTVVVPVNPDRIAGIGALRYIVYLRAQDKVVGVVSNDHEIWTNGDPRAYILANPQLTSLPLIGGTDNPETILTLEQPPQIIFITGTADTADTLQNKIGIPVVVVPSSSIQDLNNRTQMYATFRLMGKILGKEARAEDLIEYFNTTITDLELRTKDIPDLEQRTAYIGGISYGGAGLSITSTTSSYPPFAWTHVRNVVPASDLQHTDFSKEALLYANPEYIFIDTGTVQINKLGAIDEIKNPVFSELTAVRNGNVYATLPYNAYGANYETALADAYFIGKTVYPERFADIDPKEKADEIYTMTVGKPVFDAVNANSGNLGFEKIPVI